MKNIHLKHALSALIILAGGFATFYIAFLLAALVRLSFVGVLKLFVPYENLSDKVIPFLWHYVYIIVVLLISWFIYRSKIKELVKATYTSLPVVVILAETGIHFYRIPALTYVFGFVIVLSILLYLYKTKRSWLYYFAVLYAAAVMLALMLSGVDI